MVTARSESPITVGLTAMGRGAVARGSSVKDAFSDSGLKQVKELSAVAKEGATRGQKKRLFHIQFLLRNRNKTLVSPTDPWTALYFGRKEY